MPLNVENMTHDSHGVVSCISVDPYTWTLAKVCAQVAAAGPEQFRGVERVLVRHLLAPASSAVTLLLVSDMFSFLARNSTSRLCLVAHLTLFLTRSFQETESRDRELESNIYKLSFSSADFLHSFLQFTRNSGQI